MEINKITEKIEKILESDTLWEMTNIRKKETGLPVNISIQVLPDGKRKYPHNLPRIKFQNNTSTRITDVSDLIPVSISDKPQVLIDQPYDKKIFKLVKQWIILNRENLLKVWNQEISEFEFLQQMRKI